MTKRKEDSRQTWGVAPVVRRGGQFDLARGCHAHVRKGGLVQFGMRVIAIRFGLIFLLFC